MSNRIASATTRKRGRGDTPEDRKRSRAAFKAWDTRRATAATLRRKRKAAARKAVATRKANAAG